MHRMAVGGCSRTEYALKVADRLLSSYIRFVM